uniref:Uncharacterized protein n=1 Tax=Cyanoderma ruficeps TaxID=181631 RepID=A0A8C3RGP1_9PASS
MGLLCVLSPCHAPKDSGGAAASLCRVSPSPGLHTPVRGRTALATRSLGTGVAVPPPCSPSHQAGGSRDRGLRLTAKLLPQLPQRKGRSPVCTRRCRSRWELTLQAKARPHSVHWKGFSPVWMRRCRSRWELQAKAFPHTPHSKGFPPRWLFWCRASAAASAKLRPHRGQWWGRMAPGGRSPVCTRRWMVRSERWMKPFPQSGHTCGRSPLWIFRCLARADLWLKIFPHSLQVLAVWFSLRLTGS